MSSIEARAKVNLFLEVLGPREDGFHEIETVMQEVPISDTITFFEIENGIELTSDANWLPCDASNLAYKAAAEFFDISGCQGGIRLHITKRIPAGAGLGGGSSDAAAVIKGLNQLYKTNMSSSDMAEISARIGSDVPFFIQGGTALCTGRGEVVHVLQKAALLNYVIVFPRIHVASADVYKTMRELNCYSSHPRMSNAVIDALCAGNIEQVTCLLFNRLESVVLQSNQEMAEFRAAFDTCGGNEFVMTGSGAAFFKPVLGAEEAKQELNRLKAYADRLRFDVFGG